jgi:hypothetical protein
MPSQHIKTETWKKVERETVKAIIQAKKNIRTTEILDMLIQKGLEKATPADYKSLVEKQSSSMEVHTKVQVSQ